tara:strand:+ start:1478 stop:1654 length:177 start_codon:yes stop_codon:yes gene_type:complete
MQRSQAIFGIQQCDTLKTSQESNDGKTGRARAADKFQTEASKQGRIEFWRATVNTETQ